MPSTYTLNNGIELIGTGEQSGSWGDTTNTNFELIDTALDGQVTVTLASAGTSGSPNALPISDGASSNGRNRMIIFNDGADLGATAYVQLTPNDAEKIVYIRNSLSGSRSIIVFQGTYSASNDYEIPAGTTAVIYFNGGGAGAVAANVFNNAYFDSLRLGGVSVTAIIDDDTMATAAATNIPTSESVKAYVDAQVGANNELSEILANGNTTGGTDIVVSLGDQITTNTISETTAAAGVMVDGVLLKDNGITATGGGSLTGTWSNLGSVTTIDINGGTIDGTVIGGASAAAGTFTTATATTGNITTVNSTTVDTTNIEVTNIKAKDGTASATIADSTGVMTVASAVLTTADINGGTIDGATIGGSSAAAGTFTTATATTVDTTNIEVTNIKAKDGTAAGSIADATGVVTLASSVLTTTDINGGTIDGTTIGGSSAAAGTFTNLTATGTTTLAGASTTADITFGDNDKAIFGAGSDLQIYHDGAHSYIWDNGTGDLRIKTNGAGFRFLDSGNNYLANFVASAQAELYYNTAKKLATTSTGVDVTGTVTADGLTVDGDAEVQGLRIDAVADVDLEFGYANTTHSKIIGDIVTASPIAGQLKFQTSTGGTLYERMRIATNGDISFYEDTGTTPKMVWSASAESLGIGTSSPGRALDVRADPAADWQMRIGANNTDVDTYDIGRNVSDGLLYFYGNQTGYNGYVFGGVNGERMRIDASGNVGIGVTPSAANGSHLQFDSGYAVSKYGFLRNSYYDGTNYRAVYTGGATLIQGGDNFLFYTAPSVTAGSSQTFTERMRIDASGNVGIGTSSPSAPLDVVGSPGTLAEFRDGVASNFIVETSGAVTTIGNQAGSSQLAFKSSNSEAMRIDASGNVGIGTTSPQDALDVAGVVVITSTTPTLRFKETDTTDQNYQIRLNGGDLLFQTNNDAFNSAANVAQFDSSGNLLVGTNTSGTSKIYAVSSGNNHSVRGLNSTDGYVGVYGQHTVNSGTAYVAYFYNSAATNGQYLANTGSWQAISDARLKEDVKNLDTTARLMQLRPVDYLWKHQATSDNPDRRNLGFIAQEVQEVFPEIVSVSPEGMFGVEYTGLIAPLVKAIQDQRAIIEALEARITALEA